MSRLSRRQFLAALYDEATPLSAPQLEKWKALWAADPLGAYLGAQDDPGFPTYEATSPPAGLLALPVDLLRYVVQYLSHRDLHGFLSVCRSAADCTSRLKQSDVTLAVLRPDVGLAPQEMFRSHWQRERAAELHGFYFSDGDDTRQGDLVLAPHIRSVLTSTMMQGAEMRTARLQRFFSTSAPFLVELYVLDSPVDYHLGPAFDDFVGRHWDTLKIIVAPVSKMTSTAAFGKAQGLPPIAIRCFSRMPFACIEWVDGEHAGAAQTADLQAVGVVSRHVRDGFVGLVGTPRTFEAAEIVSNIRALVLSHFTACEALSTQPQCIHRRVFARIIESKADCFTEFSWIAKECACGLEWFAHGGHLSSPEATATPQRLAFQERLLKGGDAGSAVWEEVKEWMTEFIPDPKRLS
eukprot:Polyplicarium_translucidae@DN3344_c0_g1_i20.p1